MIADIARQRACGAQILEFVIDICFMIFAHLASPVTAAVTARSIIRDSGSIENSIVMTIT